MIGAAAALSPGARRALLTICTMTATIMQALDTTIANVALPYMQGSLSASLDQINWVLTSYIVAAAIMTPPTGWLAARFGRKRLFLFTVVGSEEKYKAKAFIDTIVFRGGDAAAIWAYAALGSAVSSRRGMTAVMLVICSGWLALAWFAGRRHAALRTAGPPAGA